MTVLRALIILIALAVTGTAANAQSTLLQGGAITPGHVPMYINSYSQQPIVMDSGPASGGAPGIGLSEIGITERGSGIPPFANAGTGYLGTDFCNYDAPITNNSGYHALCMGPNAQGGALISYNAFGTAAALPLSIEVNGVTETFPFGSGGGGVAVQQNGTPILTPATTLNFIGATVTQSSSTANITISGGGGSDGTPVDYVTSSGSVTAPVGLQEFIAINKTTPAATSVILPAASNWPACPATGNCPVYVIKDDAGNAATYNITVTSSDSKNFDGSSSYVLNNNHESVNITFNGTQWDIN